MCIPVGESPSGKAAGFGPAIRGFESFLPSHSYLNPRIIVEIFPPRTGLGAFLRIVIARPIPYYEGIIREFSVKHLPLHKSPIYLWPSQFAQSLHASLKFIFLVKLRKDRHNASNALVAR